MINNNTTLTLVLLVLYIKLKITIIANQQSAIICYLQIENLGIEKLFA